MTENHLADLFPKTSRLLRNRASILYFLSAGATVIVSLSPISHALFCLRVHPTPVAPAHQSTTSLVAAPHL